VAGAGLDPAERESYRILRSRADLSYLPPLSRAVTERVIHATADFGYLTDLVCAEQALAAGVAALVAGAPVVADGLMVAAGITAWPGRVPWVLADAGGEPGGVRPGGGGVNSGTIGDDDPVLASTGAGRRLGADPRRRRPTGHGLVICKAGDSLTARLARITGISPAAAAVRLAAGEAGPGAVWAVGCAPDALAEILRRETEPALVIGLPAGLAGATDAKAALRASGLPSLTNLSEKGGPVAAAAATEALLRAAAVSAGSVPAGPSQVAGDNQRQ